MLGICRKLRQLMLILIAVAIVLLYLNFKFMQNIVHGKIHVTYEPVTVVTSNNLTSNIAQVSSNVDKLSSMASVNSKRRIKPPGMLEVEKCDKLFKLYWKFGHSNYLSDLDMDCVLENYNIKGIQYLDNQSKLSFIICNPDYTRYGGKGGFENYLDVEPTNLGNCTNLSDMHFINGTRVTTLVSLPGSGNTWARLLLEQATGIFTGSIFCDQNLRSSGFFGEKIISSNVLVVKTHYPGIGNPKFNHFNPTRVDGVIFIVRNPLDSLVAERKRQVLDVNKHTGDVGPQYFGTNKDWIDYVHAVMTDTFPALIHYWLDEANIPALVLKYEDILDDLQAQLKKMLHFLQVPCSEKQIDCVVNNKLNLFHRRKVFHFDHYTPELRKWVIDGLKNVEPILNKHNVTYRDVILNVE